MGWEAWLTLAVVVLMLWALSRNSAGPDVVLMGGALLLVSFSLVSPRFPPVRELASAFGNEGVMTVAVLYVVAAALTETGGMAVVTERLLGRPADAARAQLRLGATVVAISAFLNNTPVVAMFIPVVNDWCKKIGVSPSRLLMPLSYAAILGGMCTLLGTSTNLVVHALMVDARKADPSMPLLRMFTLLPVGAVCAVAGVAFIVATSRWLLPERTPFRTDVADPRQYTVEMQVDRESAVEGLTIEQAGLRRLPGSYLSAIERDGETMVAVGPEHVLRAGDLLVFVGVVESVVNLQRIKGLRPATAAEAENHRFTAEPPAGRSRGERHASARRPDHPRRSIPDRIRCGRHRGVSKRRQAPWPHWRHRAPRRRHADAAGAGRVRQAPSQQP